MYLYKITNKINNKSYIGITNNYKRRWANECSYPSDPKRRQVIQSAIHKYGKENFSFEILENGLSIEDAVSLEEKMIAELNTMIPYGYNVSSGGEYHPTANPQFGEKNGMAKLTDEEAQYILDNRDQPLYVLYEDFNEKISYEEFKAIYNNKKFKHLSTTTAIYPYNTEFSLQFVSSPLDYGDVIELREKYAQGVFWKDAYKDYENVYTNPMSFWNMYNGNSFKLVKPEVFTKENKAKHSSLSRSGERNGRAKLTVEDVKNIRFLHEVEKKSNPEIYKLYPQVSQTSIRDVINYKTWKNVI